MCIVCLQGTQVDTDLYAAEVERFNKAMDDVIVDIDDQWQSNHESYPDPGIIAKLRQHNWNVPTDDSTGGSSPMANIDFTIQWDWIDWEYSMADTSVRYFPTAPYESLMAADPRGFDFLLQSFAFANVNPSALKLKTRVVSVDYNENIAPPTPGAPFYKARVQTHNGVQCTDYVGKRVVSTVSAGVINNDLIQWNPPLRYSVKDYNPMVMGNYVKIFYQFESQFWDDQEFIRVVPDNVEQRGHCHHWQNLNFGSFFPGSNIIRYV